MQHKICFALVLAASAVYAQLPLRQNPKDVVAVVDGREVTREELQRILYVAGPAFETKFQANPQNALFEWFLKQHLGQQGAALKLDEQSPLKERIDAVRMDFLADAYVNLEMNGFVPSQEDVRKYYDQNKSRYERVRVSGVYVKFKPPQTTGQSTADLAAMAQAALFAGQVQRSEEEARTLAIDIAKRLRAGEDMGALAQQYSEDPASQSKKGDIGFVNSTSPFPDEFRKAALALKQGEVSEPVRVSTGFYVLRADEKGLQSLNDASVEIETELRKIHLDTFMKGLNERFRPTIKDPTLIVQPVQPAQQR